MNLRSFLAAARIEFALLVAQGLTAEAAEVKVIAGVGMRPVLEESRDEESCCADSNGRAQGLHTRLRLRLRRQHKIKVETLEGCGRPV